MAFAPRAAQNTSREESATTGPHTVGLDASIGADHVLFICLAFSNDPGTITWSGFTEIASFAEGQINTRLYTKTATGSEGSTDTFTTGNSVISSHTYIRYTSATVPTSAEVATFGETAVDANPPNLDVSGGKGADDIVWIAGYNRSDDRRSTSDPTNYSNFQSIDNGGAGGIETGNSDRELNASSEDPGIFDFTGSGEDTTSYTVAIYPLAAPATVYPPFPRRQLVTVRM